MLTTIGFLVGSSPQSANILDLTEAHESHPIIHGIKIVPIDQSIKLAAGKNLIPWQQQVKAIHIQVGESQAVQARDCYSQVYGSRNKGGYPQGIHMRFVPDISDSRFPVTRGTRIKAIKMMSKQKVFLAQTKYINTSTIVGIHIFIDKIGFSLSQILMSIKSTSDESMGLFISIDENLTGGGYEVIFTVHKDRYDEANALVPLLCILLQAKFGSSIWEWFTDEAKRVLTKYRWDSHLDKVVLIDPDDDEEVLDIDSDDEYTRAICNLMNLDEETTGDGFEFNLDFVVEEVLTPKNQYGDTGSVQTFRDALNDADADLDEFSKPAHPSPSDGSPSHTPAAYPSSRPASRVTPDELKHPPSSSANEMAATLEQLILSNPALAQQILAKSSPTAVSPMQGVDGN